jgi:excisionase family DNA binding protein
MASVGRVEELHVKTLIIGGKEYIGTKEAAERLHVSGATIRRWVRQGKIEGIMLPSHAQKITAESVANYLQTGFKILELSPVQNKLDNLSQVNLAYIAGLFDGEGSISITHRKQWNYFYLGITISNTYLPVVERVQQLLGGSIGGKRYKNPKYKIGYWWRIDCRQAGQVLEMLLPYLIIKRQKAIVAIKFQNSIRINTTQGRNGRLLPLSPEEVAQRLAFKKELESC